MTVKTHVQEKADVVVDSFGTIAIRVVVLPPAKKKISGKSKSGGQPLDLDAEELLELDQQTPLGVYLDGPKGKRCCVFLVNGQRQDALDNKLIFKELGFKYLRNRMMIVVDVDGLTPSAIGNLMQGSRHGFYKGRVWKALIRRIISSLADDPDLQRLEEEAEDAVSQLEAGGEKVLETLDQLIDSHNDLAAHLTAGVGAAGGADDAAALGVKTIKSAGVVTLLATESGALANYPVLTTRPDLKLIRLQPGQTRNLAVETQPPDAWGALRSLDVQWDTDDPYFKATLEKTESNGRLSISYTPDKEIDPSEYPVRTTIALNAGFNGLDEPRQQKIRVLVKPDDTVEKPPPVLVEDPTEFVVTSRQPVKIAVGGADKHVRLRWNGLDRLMMAPGRLWTPRAALKSDATGKPAFNFTEPRNGRFSLLISPDAQWASADQYEIDIWIEGPNDAELQSTIAIEIVEPKDTSPPEPRLVDSDIKTGAVRRPPYDLKFITRDQYDTECWDGGSWTDQDPGCFLPPTKSRPLTLIVNKDMTALEQYRDYITRKRKLAESEIERRTTKYTSHVAYHLYQMHQSSTEAENEDKNPDEIYARYREEIKRVALTLIKLMEVSR